VSSFSIARSLVRQLANAQANSEFGIRNSELPSLPQGNSTGVGNGTGIFVECSRSIAATHRCATDFGFRISDFSGTPEHSTIQSDEASQRVIPTEGATCHGEAPWAKPEASERRNPFDSLCSLRTSLWVLGRSALSPHSIDLSARALWPLGRDDTLVVVAGPRSRHGWCRRIASHVIPTEGAKRASGGIYGIWAEAGRLLTPQISPLGPFGSSVEMTHTWLLMVLFWGMVGAVGLPHMSFRPRERSERAEESLGSGQKRADS
jgi:hypothetical protein